MWKESLRAFPESYTTNDSCIVRSNDGGQQGDKRAHNSTAMEFPHNYYKFVSMHDSDHDGVVESLQPFPANWEVSLIVLYYTISNRTPGSRSYSTFWIPWQTPFASTSSYSSVIQSTRFDYLIKLQVATATCRRLTCDSFQLTHITLWHTVPVIKFEQAVAAKMKTKH